MMIEADREKVEVIRSYFVERTRNGVQTQHAEEALYLLGIIDKQDTTLQGIARLLEGER